VWSCGVVLFVMLTGTLPFDTVHAHPTFEVPNYHGFNDTLHDLLSRMFAVDPAERISIEGVVSHPWFQVDFNPLLLTNEITVTSQQINESGVVSLTTAPLPSAVGEAREDAFDLLFRLLLSSSSSSSRGTVRGDACHMLYADSAPHTQRLVEKTLRAVHTMPRFITGSRIRSSFNGRFGPVLLEVEIVPTCVPALTVIVVCCRLGECTDFWDFCEAFTGTLGRSTPNS
jgi:serine/threonine protein kinase